MGVTGGNQTPPVTLVKPSRPFVLFEHVKPEASEAPPAHLGLDEIQKRRAKPVAPSARLNSDSAEVGGLFYDRIAIGLGQGFEEAARHRHVVLQCNNGRSAGPTHSGSQRSDSIGLGRRRDGLPPAVRTRSHPESRQVFGSFTPSKADRDLASLGGSIDE